MSSFEERVNQIWVIISSRQLKPTVYLHRTQSYLTTPGMDTHTQS